MLPHLLTFVPNAKLLLIGTNFSIPPFLEEIAEAEEDRADHIDG